MNRQIVIPIFNTMIPNSRGWRVKKVEVRNDWLTVTIRNPEVDDWIMGMQLRGRTRLGVFIEILSEFRRYFNRRYQNA